MPLGFAIILFAVASVAHLVRYSSGDMPPLLSAGLVGGAMVVAALLLIGRESWRLVCVGRGPLYGHRGLRWTWGRTLRLALIAPLAIAIPALFSALVVDFQVFKPTLFSLSVAFAVQTLLFAVPQELFFREAALRVFGAKLGVACAVSIVATWLFHLPLGGAGATIAAGAGITALALRLAGMNIFAVSLVQAAATVFFGRVVVAQVDETSLWLYIAGYGLGCLAFAVAVCGMVPGRMRNAGLIPRLAR